MSPLVPRLLPPRSVRSLPMLAVLLKTREGFGAAEATELAASFLCRHVCLPLSLSLAGAGLAPKAPVMPTMTLALTSNPSALAAMEAAKKAAAGLGLGGGNTGVPAEPDHFQEELEINDYPQHARWKATHRDRFLASSPLTAMPSSKHLFAPCACAAVKVHTHKRMCIMHTRACVHPCTRTRRVFLPPGLAARLCGRVSRPRGTGSVGRGAQGQ
jgi:hypothetical protein